MTKRITVATSTCIVLYVMSGALASSASASCGISCLPTLLLLGTGAGVPLDIHSQSDTPNNGILTHLGGSGAAALEGKGFSVSYNFTNLEDMSDSSYLALFLEVTERGEDTKCNTEGDKTGEILLPTALFLLVSLPGGGVGLLQLVPKFKIRCGPKGDEPLITLEGSTLSSVSPVNTKIAAGSNTALSKLHCKTTVEPELSKYLTEAGVETLIPTLLANEGGGRAKVCEEILPSVTLLPSEEVELME
jgi:hypothetical protein